MFRARVLDGAFVSEQIPAFARLIQNVQKAVDDFSETPLVPYPTAKAAIQVHFTYPGRALPWHYESKAVKAILYLNQVDGGEVEIFEDYRLLLSSMPLSSTQKVLDQILLSKFSRWLFSKKHSVIQPEAGQLVIMKANRCPHSVQPVRGMSDRISIVFLFDTPGKAHEADPELNPYFYSGFPKSA